jgi:hypothetical protein
MPYPPPLWTGYDPTTQHEVYVDDVVLSTRKVPCD